MAGGALAEGVPVSSGALPLLHPRTTRRITIFTATSSDKLRRHIFASKSIFVGTVVARWGDSRGTGDVGRLEEVAEGSVLHRSPLLKKIIDRHLPPRYRWLRVCIISPAEDHWMRGITGLVGLDDILV